MNHIPFFLLLWLIWPTISIAQLCSPPSLLQIPIIISGAAKNTTQSKQKPIDINPLTAAAVSKRASSQTLKASVLPVLDEITSISTQFIMSTALGSETDVAAMFDSSSVQIILSTSTSRSRNATFLLGDATLTGCRMHSNGVAKTTSCGFTHTISLPWNVLRTCGANVKTDGSVGRVDMSLTLRFGSKLFTTSDVKTQLLFNIPSSIVGSVTRAGTAYVASSSITLRKTVVTSSSSTSTPVVSTVSIVKLVVTSTPSLSKSLSGVKSTTVTSTTTPILKVTPPKVSSSQTSTSKTTVNSKSTVVSTQAPALASLIPRNVPRSTIVPSQTFSPFLFAICGVFVVVCAIVGFVSGIIYSQRRTSQVYLV